VTGSQTTAARRLPESRIRREQPSPLSPFRLQTARDVIDLIQEQVEAVRADPDAGAVEKARAIGSLASVALRAIEAGTLAARLEALELALRTRQGAAQ
jgi:hypothetical protein